MEYSVCNGNIGAVKCWVDGRLAGVVAPEDRPRTWYPHLMKFSPHFDTLLMHRYLIQDRGGKDFSLEELKVEVDASGNPYVYGALFYNDTSVVEVDVLIDDHANIHLPVTVDNLFKGFLVKLDPELNAIYGVHLDDSVFNPRFLFLNSIIRNIVFDYDSNLMFVQVVINQNAFSDSLDSYAIPMYRGQPLEELTKGEASILALRPENGELYSYGRVQATVASDAGGYSKLRLACGNNRLFVPCDFRGGLRLPSGTHYLQPWYKKSTCHVVFDYQGNVIGGELYPTGALADEASRILLKDSILYISCSFFFRCNVWRYLCPL